MSREPQEIEVEVIETTKISRPASPSPDESPPPDFRAWSRRIRTVDLRWWPLWLVLALVLVVASATLGVIALIFWATWRTLRGFWFWVSGR